MGELLLRAFALGNVRDHRDEVARPAARVARERSRLVYPQQGTVLADQLPLAADALQLAADQLPAVLDYAIELLRHQHGGIRHAEQFFARVAEHVAVLVVDLQVALHGRRYDDADPGLAECRAQRFLARAQRAFRRLALGDVLDHAHEVQRRTGRVAHQRHRLVHPHERAVLAQAATLRRIRGHFAGEYPRPAVGVDFAIVCVGDVPCGLREQLVARVAQHVAQLLVDLLKAPVDAVVRDADRRLFESDAEALLHLFALGDVFHHADEIGRPARVVAHERHRPVDPDYRPVAAQAAPLHRIRRDVASEDARAPVRVDAALVRMRNVDHGELQQFVARVAKHVA